MKKKIIKIDEDTLEVTEVYVDVEDEEMKDEAVGDAITDFANALRHALNNHTPEEFYQKYREMKKAEADFKEIYEPLKAEMIKLHETAGLPKKVIIGGTTLTYVSPSVRNTIDSKKLKEEEPELAKKFTKSTNIPATVKLEEI